MEAISLKKVTAIVFVCTLGAFMMNAQADNSAIETKVVVKDVVNQVQSFSELINKFDVDNNGLLSETELKVSKVSLLIESFNKMDLNADLGISEQEFNQYLALPTTK